MRIDALREEERTSQWEKYQKYQELSRRDTKGRQVPDLSAGGTQESSSTKRVNDNGKCETCESRKYKDGSDDPGVSFKTPTNVSPEQAAGAVRGHEMEHVTRERGEAAREGREVVSQSVTYHNSICPECGNVYVSGGTTKTTTQSKPEAVRPEDSRQEERKGGIDTYA